MLFKVFIFLPLCNASLWRSANAEVPGLFSVFVPCQYYLRLPTNTYFVMCYLSGFLCACVL